jgi:hypothetical protein
MNTSRSASLWLVLLGGAIWFLTVAGGCKSNTGPTTDQPLNPPTNPRAYSADDSTVVVYWTASTSRDLTIFDKYRVTALDDTGAVTSTTFTPTGIDTSLSITGLRSGEAYTFNIVATVVPTGTGYTESAPAVIHWAPAPRFDADTIGLIHLYETIGYPDSSGLIAFDTTIGGPRRVSLVSPGKDSLLLDFVVTSLGTPMYIASAAYYNSLWRGSLFSTEIDFAASLDYPRSAPPAASTYTELYVQVPNSSVQTSVIVYFRTAEGNYGRILIQRDPSKGILIWGPYPYRYLALQISYQTTPDIPYSEKARLEETKR